MSESGLTGLKDFQDTEIPMKVGGGPFSHNRNHRIEARKPLPLGVIVQCGWKHRTYTGERLLISLIHHSLWTQITI